MRAGIVLQDVNTAVNTKSAARLQYVEFSRARVEITFHVFRKHRRLEERKRRGRPQAARRSSLYRVASTLLLKLYQRCFGVCQVKSSQKACDTYKNSEN
jgi:hypothetical protein